VLPYEAPFNWAAINNFAAAHAGGAYFLFLNNDVEVIEAHWLEAMLEHAQRKEVGVVGAKLLYPNNTIQHAGVIIGMGRHAAHAFQYVPADSPGYIDLAILIRNYSAVTGACMMIRREVFSELGGFDEHMKVAFSDIDVCLRAREKNYLVVYTPYAVLYHHEMATRGSLHPEDDDQYFYNRWRNVVDQGDPYYYPYLSLVHSDFRLRL
jgi:GT2 family glycosyltransferase